ncbi:MAG: AAA family ATPase, partial [Ruminococcus sp.]
PFGVTPNKCVKIYKNFGDDSLEVLKTNPYRLCNIYGFSFKTVDEIATKTNVALDDSLRIQGCMKFLLEDSLLQGHCCLNQRELLKKSYELLNEKSDREVCSMDKIKHELCYMAKVGALKGDMGYAYLPKYYDNECETANNIFTRVSRKNRQNELKTEKIISALAEIEKEEKMSLADKQREAVVMALKENFSIITGGPGVGKTTVLKFILKTFSKITGDKNIVLLAPTGRASRRMGESINNEYPASTIHSALKITMDEDGNNEPQEEMINASIVVVDETSMCDASIFALLVKSVSLNAKIILLGDPEQLPSVGAGNVLYELLSNPYIPRTILDVIFRQADTSLIVTNAKKISSGDTNLKYGLDFQLVKAFSKNGDEVANKVIDVFMNEYQEITNLDNIQILTPMKKAGISAGATELNKKLQAIINPDKGQKTVKRHNTIFRVGDKVIQLKNTDIVSNGDIGYVTGIYEEDDDTVIEIKFANVTVKYDVTELDNVDLAYAISIHKFQGSECDTVVIPIIKSFYVMLKRNLIYTGITRGKKKVIIVGEPQAVAMAISRNDIQQRNTFLSARITELFEKLENKKQKAKAKSEQMSLFKN